MAANLPPGQPACPGKRATTVPGGERQHPNDVAVWMQKKGCKIGADALVAYQYVQQAGIPTVLAVATCSPNHNPVVTFSLWSEGVEMILKSSIIGSRRLHP